MKKSSTIKPNSILSKLIDLWLDMVENRIKITTYQKYSNIIRIHIIPKLGNIKIKYLNTFTINDFTNCMLITLSSKTVNNILVVLGMIFKFGEEEFHLNFPKIKCVKENHVEMRVLNKAEQMQLINFLVKDMDSFKLAILFALYTGVRIGELCALKSEDIIENTVFINKTIQRIQNGNKTEVVVLPPKSNTSVRYIPIPKFIIPLINEYKGNNYFISQDNGKFVEPRLLQLKFQQYLNECNIKDASFHTLRHTFATRCIEAGCDVKSLSEMLGHSDVKTTLNKYVHSSFEQKRKNIEKLEYIISV